MSYYDHNDIDKLRETLIGRSVTAVQLTDSDDRMYGRSHEGKLVLDDGTELLLGGNDGGCSCGAGDYELVRLNDMPVNGIMSVEIDVENNDKWEDPHTYRIFVLAQDERFVPCKVELAAFEGDDGNGYYGTGFWFSVKEASDA